MVRVATDIMFKAKVKASSLIEVITALIIISLVFSLAIVVYLNVQRSGFSSKKLRYSMILDEVYSGIHKETLTGNKEFDYGDVIVHQEIKVHSSFPSLLLMQLAVRNEEGKLLAEKKFMKYVAPDR